MANPAAASRRHVGGDCRRSRHRARKYAAAAKLHLRSVLASDPKVTAQLDPDRIAELFEPGTYQGVSQAMIDRLLASLEGRCIT
ncbi:adenylosuccinate lyase [Bradyrhizobium sp. JR1.5]